MKLTNCRDCDTRIALVRRVDNGRYAVLDAQPAPGGRVALVPAIGGQMADVLPAPPADGTAHRFHSQTCPGRATPRAGRH